MHLLESPKKELLEIPALICNPFCCFPRYWLLSYIWFLCLSKPAHTPDWTPARLTFSLLNSIQHNVAYWKKSTQMTQSVMKLFFFFSCGIHFFPQNENGPHYLRISKSEIVSSNIFLCIGCWKLTKNSSLRSCFLPNVSVKLVSLK